MKFSILLEAEILYAVGLPSNNIKRISLESTECALQKEEAIGKKEQVGDL